MPQRRRAREFTLQILYSIDLRKAEVEDVLSTAWHGAGAHPVERRFAEAEVRGVVRHLEAIDGMIEACSKNWKLSRMSYIDRNILRLGVYELLHVPEVPRSVVINECIELGKCYSTAESGAFINGILDRISRENPREGGAEAES